MISALLRSPHSLAEDLSSNLIRARDALEDLHSITGGSISGTLRKEARGATRVQGSSHDALRGNGIPSTSAPGSAHEPVHATDGGKARKKMKLTETSGAPVAADKNDRGGRGAAEASEPVVGDSNEREEGKTERKKKRKEREASEKAGAPLIDEDNENGAHATQKKTRKRGKDYNSDLSPSENPGDLEAVKEKNKKKKKVDKLEGR